jgi:hypothetical protein
LLVSLPWRFSPLFRPTAEGPAPAGRELVAFTTVASAVLFLTVPLWTALSLGRYVRGASKQTA